MNHAQLRAFHAVAQEGSFTAAADRLGLSQPAVTIQVKALEESFDVELFHRRGRRVALTETGQALYGLSSRIFGLEEEARNLLHAAAGLRTGRLKIAADGPYHVIGLVAAFRQRYPGISVNVTIGNSREVRERLLAYQSDVAVLAEQQDDSRFFVLPHGRHRAVAFVPREHKWAGRTSIRLAELHGQPMVLRETGSATRSAFEAAAAAAGVTPDYVLEIGSREAVREAVAAGVGIGIVQEAELGHDERLRALPITDAEIVTEEFLVCLAERRESPIIQAFLEMADSGETVPT